MKLVKVIEKTRRFFWPQVCGEHFLYQTDAGGYIVANFID